MKSSILATALVAASQLYGVAATPRIVARQEPLQKPKVDPIMGSPTSHGCYSSNANMTKVPVAKGEKVSSGNCRLACIDKYDVISLHGTDCFCGNYYPPDDDLVEDEKCNFACRGYGDEACGGNGVYSVWDLGTEPFVEIYEPEDEPEATTTSGNPAPTESGTEPNTQDPVETTKAAESGDKEENSDDGPNVGAIVAGVVVGVVVIAAAIGGGFFWMRRKRNTEIEEEHRRNAAVNAFISGSKPPGSSGSISMTDSRLDPVLAHRRLSDGSIADEQDYSRKILRVTNA